MANYDEQKCCPISIAEGWCSSISVQCQGSGQSPNYPGKTPRDGFSDGCLSPIFHPSHVLEHLEKVHNARNSTV